MRRMLVSLLIILGVTAGCSSTENQRQKKILEADGYVVKQLRDSQPFEIFIKPEWIPFKSEERLKENHKLVQLNQTTIYLQDVWNRGKFANDIYFSFHTTYQLNRDNGTFMSNNSYNGVGTISSFYSIDAFTIYDSKHHEIIIGETGSGPGSDFSFAVDYDQLKDIKNGFYLKYTGMHVYAYSASENVELDQAANEAISNYIVEHYKDVYSGTDKSFEVHKVYGSAKAGNEIKVYMYSLYGGFNKNSENSMNGHSLPAVVTLKQEDGAYTVTGYKEPQDGDENAKSIKSMFPEKYHAQIWNDKTNSANLEDNLLHEVQKWQASL
ncbi:hypothetical protein A8990_10737 [Paenibacillus taihuensis]|uniref:Lipoprotein n=1 Tax=Paenibacillus taihuensis TaxID=1156355 RepID=A0A3D9SD49_9BACL|nr:hypothetical protein [Paenibacillus taihuensis]REE88941.1 hypothetical protein A8990_10737 [Paenibacillus taihuensis]